jgi:hypothetical protein
MPKVDMSDSNSILTNVLIIIVVIAIAYLIYYIYTTKFNKSSQVYVPSSENVMRTKPVETFQDPNPTIKKVSGSMNGVVTPEDPISNKKQYNPMGSTLTGENKMEGFSTDSQYKNERNLTSFPKDQLTADELLPQDNSSLWAQVNPSGVGSLKDRSFLQAGYNIGINTVGQTLRNPNLQLRSEPPCPQIQVSPWSQSSIEPDVSRKPFEIGGCA